MRCWKCQADNPKGKKFCGKCGAGLAGRCPKCGAENPPDNTFCGDCGAPLSGLTTTPAPSARAPIQAVATTGTETLEGERKTVTALFADIKGSTELEQDLDPEEARAIVDPALKLMIDAVRRYDGYIVQSTGDGIFALFGAPVAHEDHPQRAVYAALRMQDELQGYSRRLRESGNLPIEARVGLNTGEVVVRSITTGSGHSEYTPIGHTTNLASRVQALAPTGSIAISETTRKLVEGYFTLKSLGASRVKGIAEPVNVYEVTGLGPLRSRLQRAAGRGLTKFVGREREMEALAHAAEQAKAGHGQLVATMAEAGTGKSRLLFEFKAKNQSEWMVLEAFSVSHGKASAYLPVLDLLHNYFRITSEDDARTRREKVTGRVVALDPALEDTRAYLFALLGIAEGDDPLVQMDAQVKKRRTLDSIKRILLRESLNQPLMVMFEDLHWIDEETQALLNLLADSIGTAKILLLVNYRPEYSHSWSGKTYYTQLRLDPLGKQSAAEMLQSLIGDAPELAALKRLIIDKTEGNPFFMEEIVQTLYEEGALARNGKVKLTRPLDALKVPTTVQALLAARIDRLPPANKDLLQTVAVLGKDFQLDLAAKVAAKPVSELEPMFSALQLAEFIYEQPAAAGVEYTFKHALTQEVAYNSLLMEHRKLLHDRVGQALEVMYADALDDQIDQLAHHYRRSANAAKAVRYLQLAGEQSARRSSPREALGYLREALERIRTLPPADERDRAELEVQFAIGSALSAESWSAPEKIHAFERVSELAERTGTGAEVFAAICHLAEGYISQGRLGRAHELADQCWRLAESSNDRRLLLGGHHVVAETAYWMGNLIEARSRDERATELYDRAVDGELATFYGIDPFVLSCGMLAFAELLLGRPERALRLSVEARGRASEVSHLYSIGFSLMISATVHLMRRDAQAAETVALELLAMCREHGFTEMLGWEEWVRGWAAVEQGRAGPGVETLAESIALHESAGGTPGEPWRRGVLAEGFARAGRLSDARDELCRAFAAADHTQQHFFDAELHRIAGQIALLSDPRDDSAAEKQFREAILIANRQDAKWWELRATTSLARLLRDTNRRDEARAMFADIYNWFTEGFDTADLKDAKLLLDELSN